MMLQKVLQWDGQALISVVADEPRPGESQEVFETRLLVMLEKVYGLAYPKPTNPSMYSEETD